MKLIERPGPLLSELTTLKLGGRAAAELVAVSPRALDGLPEALDRIGLPMLLLGRGSNLLALDGELDAVVLRLGFGEGPAAVEEGSGLVRIRVGADMGLPRLTAWMARHGLAGLENLAGIPGSVGGAVAMNAGSFGTCVADCLARVRVFTPEHGLDWMDVEELELSYRRFRPRRPASWFVVAEAEFMARREDPVAVRDRLRAIFQKKKASQPLNEATAGCLFKNPAPDAPAGRLLDECGLKGRRLGGMGFSGKHANFLVNHGGGRSSEALELATLAREQVKARFGLDLELEVRIFPWS